MTRSGFFKSGLAAAGVALLAPKIAAPAVDRLTVLSFPTSVSGRPPQGFGETFYGQPDPRLERRRA